VCGLGPGGCCAPAPANCRTNAAPRQSGYRHQRGDGEWKSENYPVRVEWTGCTFGGRRAWFLCPAQGCGRRVAILYSGGIFACRHCYKLAYACQRENADDRAMRRADNVRQQLGWGAGIANPKGGKPKGMHWATFARLSAKQDAFAWVATVGSARRLGLLNGRLARLIDDLPREH